MCIETRASALTNLPFRGKVVPPSGMRSLMATTKADPSPPQLNEGFAMKQYPIQSFVDNRLKELGFWRGELVKRCGYKNVSKGVRRLQKLYSGDLVSPSSCILLANFPHVLAVEQETVIQAIKETHAELDAEDAQRDAEWRAAFQPNAFVLGTSLRPSQIFAFGLTGGVERYLRIPLDISRGSDTFIEQAMKYLNAHPQVPFFGPSTGFIINYTPDRTEHYDKEGNLLNVLDSYYYPGTVRLTISGREIPPGLFAK